ncbi:MAG: endonuclease III [Pseudomonadota bacterium]
MAVTKADKSAPRKNAAKSAEKTPRTNSKPALRKKKRAPRRIYSEAEVRHIFKRLEKQNPEPRGELDHVNTYTLLVAVVLSAQATDAGVNKATKDLFKIADTPDKMLALGEERVRDYIKTIGLYKAKAKNVIALSERLIAEHSGEVPNDQDYLETLPGVGRKTANVVRNMAFQELTIAVDTHLFRIGNRMKMAPGKIPNDVEDAFHRIIPDDIKLHAHHWLILHGRYICVARKPKCDVCVIADLCKSKEKTNDVPPPGYEF